MANGVGTPKVTFEPVSEYTWTALVVTDDGQQEKEVTENVDPVESLTFSHPDSGENVTIEEWPYTTDVMGEIDFLRGSPLVKETNVEEPEPNATNSAVTKAEQEGVDLREVSGTGRGGQITTEDVVKHAEAKGVATEGNQTPQS
jgi:pyruvate/2-oxoglutarate dehydrogenase complex dihydrolipoamide acyltransferase (E2) component